MSHNTSSDVKHGLYDIMYVVWAVFMSVDKSHTTITWQGEYLAPSFIFQYVQRSALLHLKLSISFAWNTSQIR